MHGFNYEHIVTTICVLFALWATWRFDRRHSFYIEQDEELAAMLYLLTDTLEEYRKLMDRNCCWHQKACPSKGDARILPQVFHAVEIIGKRALPAGTTLSSEDAFSALKEQLSIYAKQKYNINNLDEVLGSTDQLEDADEQAALEASSASPRPRGRPKKNPPV